MSARQRQVIWTEIAARDLERIATRLSQDPPGRAERIIDRLLARAEALSTLSHRGGMPPELRTIADRSWREVVESPWRIVYRVGGETVEIHAVLDGRRDLSDILLERMLDL